jgi:hypothetical protein
VEPAAFELTEQVVDDVFGDAREERWAVADALRRSAAVRLPIARNRHCSTIQRGRSAIECADGAATLPRSAPRAPGALGDRPAALYSARTVASTLTSSRQRRPSQRRGRTYVPPAA